MIKTLITILATAAVLFVTVVNFTMNKHDEGPEIVRQVIAELSPETTLELYEYACDFVQGQFAELRETDCPNPPVTILGPMGQTTYGYYVPGSSIIWINSRFRSQPNLSTFGEGVTVHEAVHYTLHQFDVMMDDNDYCREENLAWTAYDNWVLDRERPEDVAEAWWEWYPHCDGPFANPNTEITIAIRKIFT